MVIINKSDYRMLLPLYFSGGYTFPLIQAVLENQQDGLVFVDNASKPSSCIVINKFGFFYMFGDMTNVNFNEKAANLLFNNSSLMQTYLLWYATPENWIKKFERLPAEFFRKRERIRYQFDKHKFQNFDNHMLPDQYELKKIDQILIKKMDHFQIDFPVRFWRSEKDFLENGIGFCALYKDQVIGICYSACVSGGLAEIDVATIEEHRGKRIGSMLVARFIQQCIREEINPTWDCFTYNEPSRRLAGRMGFVETNRYPFYSFNRPLSDENVVAKI